jgi:hypothetical protein
MREKGLINGQRRKENWMLLIITASICVFAFFGIFYMAASHNR